MARVMTAIALQAPRMEEAGRFSRNDIPFDKAMSDYLKHEAAVRSAKTYETVRVVSDISLARFGATRLSRISRQDVRQWIEAMCEHYRGNSIQTIISVPCAMVNWMRKDGAFVGDNPFSAHQWKTKEADRVTRPTIDQAELAAILPHLPEGTRIAVLLAYHTGLRPSEVCRILPSDINHDTLILTVREQKTRTGERYVAIPKKLSAAIIGTFGGPLPAYHTVKENVRRVVETFPALAGLSLGTFRKNFAAVMEQAGCPLETIDAHCGRYQNSVIARHYLRDQYRAVKLMRPFLNAVWDGEQGAKLTRAK